MHQNALHFLTLDLGKVGIIGNIKDINMEAGILGRRVSLDEAHAKSAVFTILYF